jgi:hypothetical protein
MAANRHRTLIQFNLLIINYINLTLTVENNTSIPVISKKRLKYGIFVH